MEVNLLVGSSFPVRRNLIACVNQQNALGKQGELLYLIPLDFQWFKRVTGGHTLIMGVKTYKEIGRPLPGREMIVVYDENRGKPPSHPAIRWVTSLDAAYQLASTFSGRDIFVIGGAGLFAEAQAKGVDCIYRTMVWDDKPGDVHFLTENEIKRDYQLVNDSPLLRSDINRLTGEQVDFQFEVWQSKRFLERADNLTHSNPLTST